MNIFDHSIDQRIPKHRIEVFRKMKINTPVLFDFQNRKIIDVIATRRKHYLIDYFSRISQTEKGKVSIFVMDMWESYREAVKLSFQAKTWSIHLASVFKR